MRVQTREIATVIWALWQDSHRTGEESREGLRQLTAYKGVTAMLHVAFAPWSKQPAFVPWTAASQRRRPLWMPHSSPMQAGVPITESAVYARCGHRPVPLRSRYA